MGPPTRRRLPLLLLSCAILATTPATAASRGRVGETVRVASVDAWGTVVLDDGRAVRLAAVRLPAPDEPLAAEAVGVLGSLVTGRAIGLRPGSTAQDRHGRIVAQIVRDDGLWVQAELLRLGWARLFAEPADVHLPDDMRAAERDAESSGRGLWGHPAHAARTPDGLGDSIGTWRIVRGRVLRTARVGDRIYLNFGPDYRTDFTVEIAAGDRKAFVAAGVDPLALEGRRVEVRGWVEDRNGPAVAVPLPIRLRVLD